VLQESDIEIKNKQGCENLIANHLSKIFTEYTDELVGFSNHFPDEELLVMPYSPLPWFTHIVNYLIAREIPLHWSKQRKICFSHK